MKNLIILLILVSGCSLFGDQKTYEIPIKTSAALAQELSTACKSSVAKKQPMLIEFSAKWCGDCQKLSGMKSDTDLAAELKRWDFVVINVGQFDQHTELLEAYQVNAIANWSVVAPSDCEKAAAGWAIQAQRTLEPKSGKPVTSAELASWLQNNRKIRAIAKSENEPVRAVVVGITGIVSTEAEALAAASVIDTQTGNTEAEVLPLDDFAAEGALARIWRNADGKWVKLSVESKGETYDGVDTIYAVDGQPFFARRFHFSDPSKFDEEGSETYAQAVAARATESTLFFFAEGRPLTIKTTGSLPANQVAKLHEGSSVEPSIEAVYNVETTSEDFKSAAESIAETLSVVASKSAK